MKASPSRLYRRPGFTAGGVLLFAVAVGFVIAMMLFPPPLVGSLAPYIAVALIPIVLFSMSASARGHLVEWLLTPIGLLLGFLWLSILLVPILWALNLATPWGTFPLADETKILLFAVLCTVFVQLGATLAGSRPTPLPHLVCVTRSALPYWAVFALLAGATAVLSARTGGIGFLMANLLNKRALLQGLGPLTALAASAAVASLAVAQMERSSVSMKIAGTACGIGYTGYLFVLGSRFPIVAFLLALLVARMARGKVPRRALGLLALAVIPFSVWYSVTIRKGQILGAVYGGFRDQLKTFLDPFVYGGVDVLNTFGAVAVSNLPLLSFDPSLVAHNLTTMVPRALWPSKPPGFSVGFSERFFPLEWSRGSGVPPSITAEFLYVYGIIGGCVMLAVLGFLLAKVGQRLAQTSRLYWRLVYPFITVDCIVLAKSGSDAFLQQVSLHLVGAAIFIIVSRAFGGSIAVGGVAREHLETTSA